MIIELIAGAVLAMVFVALARRQGPRVETRLYAAGLIIAALIYVGFAFIGAAERRWVLIELVGLFPFTGFAWLGLRYAAWWLAAGWVAHAGWDIGLHLVMKTPVFVPGWYPMTCVGFDLLVAAAIALRVLARRPLTSQTA